VHARRRRWNEPVKARAQVVAGLCEAGVIPVVRADSEDAALRVVESLAEGGLRVFEITMTVPGALALVGRLVKSLGGDALVGVGSVLDAETARACAATGADFVVSPALNLDVVACCRARGLAVMPGALTPTEIATAWKAGADLVKVFPVSAMGGANYIRAIRAPMPQVGLVPTGGVTLDNVGGFIAAGACAVGVGANLVDPSAAPGQIAAMAKAWLAAVKAARERC
jgi:2-dehydro-3-deoxyphosphogluconate aldolase/(4S)-4-hydroxy-2-oxoglutarate aldolase